MKINFKVIGLVAGILIPFVSLNSSAKLPTGNAAEDSLTLIQSAQNEILFSQTSGNTETACSTYLLKVLRRATFEVPHFVANTFHESVQKALPDWRMNEFAIDETKNDVEALTEFLNSLPDQTALLAQWPRIGQSGHVAMIVKVSADNFMIYQAQMGLSLPHSKQTTVKGLLYAKSKYGDRSHLRLFYE